MPSEWFLTYRCKNKIRLGSNGCMLIQFGNGAGVHADQLQWSATL